MKIVSTPPAKPAQRSSELRELSVDEIESVAGGGTGSNTSSSSYQGGGNDGFGGGRRNP